jgi:hypothetical protein
MVISLDGPEMLENKAVRNNIRTQDKMKSSIGPKIFISLC